MWFNGNESACQWGRHRRRGFSPWVRKIPWSRKWQPTAVFLPEKPRGQGSFVYYSPWGHKSQAPLSMHAWWSQQKWRMVKSHPLSQQESTSTCPVCVHCPENHLDRTFSVVSELLFHWLTQLYSKQQGWEAKRRDNRRETPAWEDRRMMISCVVTRR